MSSYARHVVREGKPLTVLARTNRGLFMEMIRCAHMN
jgi:hypothetical protein